MSGVMIVRRQVDGAGYLFSDNRAAHEGVEEADVVCCTHCQAIINYQVWRTADGGFCHKCMAPICGFCADKMLHEGCTPFMKQLEESLEKGYRRQQLAKILGV